MKQRRTLRERIEARITSKRRDSVFLPREFRDLGGEDQVLRVLRGLVRDRRLMRLGYGVYGRTVVSQPHGQAALHVPKGLLGAAEQALTKLGVEWEQAATEGGQRKRDDTQPASNPVVRVRGRFSRRLSDGDQVLRVERAGRKKTAPRGAPTRQAAAIFALAKQHGVAYSPTAADAWANDVTRLAGDDVQLDDVELLLIALQRAGRLSRGEALRMQAMYLREARP